MMDTKEALKELDDLIVDYGNRNEEQIARLDEAIDMAMEALRNLPNRLRQAMDTINRKEAIDEVCKAGCGSGFCGVECDEVLALRNMPSAQPETHEERTETHACDCISRQAAIDAVDDVPYIKEHPNEGLLWKAWIEQMPSAQPERTCVNCGRTVNNGGWYADGGTRCPIEEHYALPKDGYCHLWEKRNVTDDDYPERRTDEA